MLLNIEKAAIITAKLISSSSQASSKAVSVMDASTLIDTTTVTATDTTEDSANVSTCPEFEEDVLPVPPTARVMDEVCMYNCPH